MSMARCDDCENLIDTDADPEAIFETEGRSHKFVTLCQWCRERDEAEADAKDDAEEARGREGVRSDYFRRAV